jgi:predicted enzyme related to lactoylglutathione lyase
MRVIKTVVLAMALAGGFAATCFGNAAAAPGGAPPGVGPQYDSTHVYVAPEDFDRFVASVIATFGGAASKRGEFQVTPTPSRTLSQLVATPTGTFSVFGFMTPIPYPFGAERTGYLVADLDAAVDAARANGADVVVAPFADPIGRDAIVEWPGGVLMQLYWHNVAPSYPPLRTVPDNRVYVPVGAANAFIRSFVGFSQGMVVADESRTPGMEIGRPGDFFRCVRIESAFGKMTVLATDGRLPYPYGRETTGYEVADLAETLQKAEAAGATMLVAPYAADGGQAAIVQFPGGYIAEIHAPGGK